MKLALFLALTISIIFQLSLTTIPLMLIILNCFMVIYKRVEIVIFALFFGAIFDVLSFSEVGISSLFFTVFLFLVLLYQRKFEINTISFVAVSTFLGSLSYLFTTVSKLLIFESVTSSAVAVLFIFILQKRYG